MSVAGEQRMSKDGHQDGFTSDGYSCAVAFAEKYGLNVTSNAGVNLPETPKLKGE